MPAANLASLRDARWRVMLPSVVVLGLGLYFRCAHLGAQPFGPDEGLKSLQTLIVEEAPHPPLYYLLLRLWAALAGDSAAGLRALSVLAGLLAIPLGYGLVMDLLGSRRAAALAATLLAVSPLQVLESQQACPEALATLVVLGSSWALLRALRLDRRRDWAWYELSVVAGMYTHLMVIPVMVAHGVSVAVWPWRLPAAVVRYGKAAVGGVLAFVPWAVVMLFQRLGPASASGPAGWGAALTGWLELFEVPAYLAATFVVAWLLARGCESSATCWRRISRGATVAVLLCGVVANAARGFAR